MADDQRRLDKTDVYFKEAGEFRFVPRAALVDLEPSSLDVIKASAIGTHQKDIISLFPNPSYWEAVTPVVAGKTQQTKI